MSRGNYQGVNLSSCSSKALPTLRDDNEKTLNPFLWPSLFENRYRTYDNISTYSTRVDRPAQTELSLSKHNFLSTPNLAIGAFDNQTQTQTRCTEQIENLDDHHSQQDILYESPYCNFSSSLYDVSMSSRKNYFDKFGGAGISDLERKKLEAELKAAQEIARIQQTVIEKRLALELASLQNSKDGKGRRDNRENCLPQQAHHFSRAQQDLALMDEGPCVEKRSGRHTVAENAYVCDMEPQKMRPLLAKPVPSMSSRLINSDRIKNAMANEILWKKPPDSFKNPPSPGYSELQAPELKYYNTSHVKVQRPPLQIPSQRDMTYERAGWPGHPPRNRLSWKAFIGKMKRGFRGTKRREDWE